MAGSDVFGGSAVRDFANAKYIITMGHNVYEGMVIGFIRQFMTAIEKGAKIVTFEPRFSAMAAKSDEWHAIKPGHDLPFVLAFNHVLIYEDLYDKEFVEKNCTGFEELKASLASYTPEKMAAECDIPAETIRRIAHEFAAAAPQAIFDFGHRCGFSNQELDLRRAMMIANVLVGAVEKPGGYFLAKGPGIYNQFLGDDDPKAPVLGGPKLPAYPPVNVPRIDRLGEADSSYYLAGFRAGVTTLVPHAALEELPGVPYKLKGWFIARHNPVMTHGNTQKVIEGLKAMDLVVVVDIQVSDTAWFADIVLPDTTYLERDEEFTQGGGKMPNYSVGRQKAVEPLGEARPIWQIATELGYKMGLQDYFPCKDMEEYRVAQVKGNKALMETLKKDGVASYGVPLLLQDKKSVAAFVKKFPGAASKVNAEGTFDFPKKISLFSERLERVSQNGGLVYKPYKFKEDDELYMIGGKIAVRTNGHNGNNPWLNELCSEAGIWIHPETAGALGIKNGDAIEVYNQYNTQKGHALVTEGVRKDSVFSYFGFGHISQELKRAYGKGTNTNSLTPPFIAPNTGTNLHFAGVKIRKV